MTNDEARRKLECSNDEMIDDFFIPSFFVISLIWSGESSQK